MIPALTAGGRPSDKTDEHGRSTLHFVALIVFYLLYLLLGAAVFSAIEQPYEQKLRQDLRLIKATFLREHLCLDANNLEVFLARVMDANSFGVSVLHNASGNVNWDFFSSLFFTSTVLSTTGTDHLASCHVSCLHVVHSSTVVARNWINIQRFARNAIGYKRDVTKV